jgi:hypothetical protein
MRPCPCDGCINGHHSQGLTCRWCGGKGYVVDTDWPRPCWHGHGSDDLPPYDAEPARRHHHAPSSPATPDLARELDTWLEVRNRICRWAREHPDFGATSEAAVDGINRMRDLLPDDPGSGQQVTLSADVLSDFVSSVIAWLELYREIDDLKSQVVNATDTMFHTLGWTGPVAPD